jgi:hypothetical protein
VIRIEFPGHYLRLTKLIFGLGFLVISILFISFGTILIRFLFSISAVISAANSHPPGGHGPPFATCSAMATLLPRLQKVHLPLAVF